MTRLAASACAVAAFTAVVASTATLGGRQAGDARVAPVLTCGSDATLASPIAVTAANVILAGDGRLYAPCPQTPAPPAPHPVNHREIRERALLDAAVSSADPDVRRLAAQANGRLGRTVVTEVPATEPVVVRREMAYALGSSPAVADAARLIETWLGAEREDTVAQVLLESLGRLRYPDAPARDRVEPILVAATRTSADRRLGAVKGLEVLVRLDPRREIQPATRTRLREIAVDASADARVRRLAMLALATARDDDAPTLSRAAADGDWQVRRLAALRLDLGRADHAAAGARLDQDAVWQVRYDYLAAEGRRAGQLKSCAALRGRLADAEPAVVLRAIDLLATSCASAADLDQVAADLLGRARALSPVPGGDDWHVPARALTALARVRAGDARPLIASAAAHAVWQVRVAAATAAGSVGDDATLELLAGDAHPNVRTTALEALGRRSSPRVFALATRALTSPDHQLVRAAAGVLRAAPADQRDTVVGALLASLTRLTDEATDTSRDPRVAIVTRLEELLPAARVRELQRYLGDYDPAVRAAAVSAWTKVAPSVPPPAVASRFRYPQQPSADALAAIPRRAVITMVGGGRMEMELYPEQAAVTVARFAELAQTGHYNGLTFHRVVPNFVIQGGSPGANEYVGDVRYMRDETGPGAAHVRGAVGISTRGRDTGDAQIFIDLVDLPRLDHDYTVFGKIVSGLDVLDRVLEGARIERITIQR